MSPEYKRQHYVPRTYLESWNDNTKKIRVYNKDDNKLYKYCKPNKALFENDFYTKKVEDVLVLTNEEKCKIFKALDGYKVIYENNKEEKELVSLEEYAIYYFDFENWNVLREDGTFVNKKLIKDKIEKVRITELEEQWKIVENDWGTLANKIESYILNQKALERSDLNDLLTFMVAQKWRTPNALNVYKNLINSILFSLKETIGCMYEVERDSLSNAVFKKQIMKFQSNDENSNILKEIEALKNCHMVFYQPIGRQFITSDNPIITIIDNNLLKGNYNGIYFPISPQLMLALYRGDKDKYLVTTMRSNIVRRFNNRIKACALKYYVTNYKL